MSSVKEHIHAILSDISVAANDAGRQAEEIHLIAVSKKKPISAIEDAYAAGQRHFGENYIQEAMDKIDAIPHNDIIWHFIGHLQRNKAKFAVKYFDVIHTVDSLKLAEEINKQAKKINKVQDILIQIKIGDEETKSGVLPTDAISLISEINSLPHVCVKGLMTIPPPADTGTDSRHYFRAMARLKSEIISAGIPEKTVEFLSMGMTDDFKEAVSEGATHVRVGTAIFGVRA